MDKIQTSYLSKIIARKKAFEWALVLEAMGIPFMLRRFDDMENPGQGFLIEVRDENIKNAENQINLYEMENYGEYSGSESQGTENIVRVNLLFTLLICFLIYMFQFIVQTTDTSFHWIEYGNASAEEILKGEWWRAVTALTIHADLAHVLSNMVLLCIIAQALCSETGFGLGWFLILLSGASGNLLNAFVHVSYFQSIGSSTAVFGAIGCMAGIRLAGGTGNARNKQPSLKVWVPMIGALGLLGFLGMGENSDIAAHFFGFVIGSFLGISFGVISARVKKPDLLMQILFGLISLSAVIISWIYAFRAA